MTQLAKRRVAIMLQANFLFLLGLLRNSGEIQAVASAVHITSEVAQGYAEKMKHTDLITDKDAGYVESISDQHYRANFLASVSYNLRAKSKCKLINVDIIKPFLNHLNILIKCGYKQVIKMF